MNGLTEGRIVHYVLNAGRSAGQHRPAIVVRDWKQAAGTVNLLVFLDGDNDGLGRDGDAHTEWVTSVVNDEDEKKPRTWHWPEREDASVGRASETASGETAP